MAEKHNINKKIEEILDLTDQCVKCGMCLPHCPTNQLTKLEGHSPRGRIALWQNLANGKLELTEKTYDYLNQCLGCGACVNNCPAGVEFLDIQDTGKSYLLPNQTASKPSITRAKLGFLTRVFITIFSSKKHTQKLHYFLYYYQKLRLHYIFNTIILPLKLLRLQILNKLLDKINNLYLALPKISRHNKTQAGVLNPISEVILFTGCVNKIAANNTITAALTILGKLNIKAHLVDNLHCCGALFKHNGKLDKFDTNSKYNIENINKLLETNSKISTILSIDTGCHPELALRLRGKHKPEYTPHVDTGDFLVVLNASKLQVTGKKAKQKIYYRHTGYPGGLKEMTFEKMMEKNPARVLELAVKGMLPKNSLGRAMFKKLKVYSGTEHPHAAQQPVTLELA